MNLSDWFPPSTSPPPKPEPPKGRVLGEGLGIIPFVLRMLLWIKKLLTKGGGIK